MKDEGIILTFPDGTPLGKVTNFQACAAVTGDVYIMSGITPSDVTPARVTIGVKDFAYYDPFENPAPKVGTKPNRKQRRKKK